MFFINMEPTRDSILKETCLPGVSQSFSGQEGSVWEGKPPFVLRKVAVRDVDSRGFRPKKGPPGIRQFHLLRSICSVPLLVLTE